MSTENDSEVWVPVKGHEGEYEVSNHGRVKSLSRIQLRGVHKTAYPIPEKILSSIKQNSGYVHVFLGTKNQRAVHRLVLESFVGSCPEGMQALHYDNNRSNNHIDNLRWGTPKDNSADRHRHGTAHNGPYGDTHPFAKLNGRKVRRIRKEYATGRYTLEMLKKRHKVHIMTLSDLIRRETWKHVK